MDGSREGALGGGEGGDLKFMLDRWFVRRLWREGGGGGVKEGGGVEREFCINECVKFEIISGVYFVYCRFVC